MTYQVIGWQCEDFIRVSVEITTDASTKHGCRHVFVYLWLSLEQACRATICFKGNNGESKVKILVNPDVVKVSTSHLRMVYSYSLQE